MNLELDPRFAFSPGDFVLIEQARRALADVDFFFEENTQGVGKRYQVVTALAYPDPLRLDFKAHVPDEVGQAFLIEPQEPLVPALFEGDRLSHTLLNRLEQAVDNYFEYLCGEN